MQYIEFRFGPSLQQGLTIPQIPGFQLLNGKTVQRHRLELASDSQFLQLREKFHAITAIDIQHHDDGIDAR